MAQRLQIRFDQDSAQSQDDEPFAIDGLESWALLSRLTERDQFADDDLNAQLQQRLETIRREGVLPLSHTGEQIAVQLMGRRNRYCVHGGDWRRKPVKPAAHSNGATVRSIFCWKTGPAVWLSKGRAGACWILRRPS
jgi:hypothetical protein